MFHEAELQTPNGLLLCLSLELVYSTFKGQDSMKAALNGKQEKHGIITYAR